MTDELGRTDRDATNLGNQPRASAAGVQRKHWLPPKVISSALASTANGPIGATDGTIPNHAPMGGMMGIS